VNNLIVKGVHLTKSKDEIESRWSHEDDKSMKCFNKSELQNDSEWLNIYMYDISNYKSFELLKQKITPEFIKGSKFSYLVGNK